MTAFLIKSSICMLLFFGLYWFLLRKEKLLVFNRYFLIFSILISLVIPFVSFTVNLGTETPINNLFTSISIEQKQNPVQKIVYPPDQISIQKITQTTNLEAPASVPSVPVTTHKMNITSLLVIIYLSGFALMMIRFCRNMIFVFRMSGRSQIIDHEWYKLALLERQVNPFSFLKTVFLNEKDYLENRIAENVIRHELEHVKQSHSVDVIFFEILHIVLWFNPVLFLYKRAVSINHEYLADEAVIRNSTDIKTYGDELINFISRRVNVPFTSGFSPSMIRLRLLMLNTNTTPRARNIRVFVISVIMVFTLGILSISPAYPGTQDHKNKKTKLNEDILIDDVLFRDQDFKQMKALVVFNGTKLGNIDTLRVDVNNIKNISILKGRKAIRKYGRNAKNGAVVISTYESDNKSVPDTSQFKPIYTLNDTIPKSKISIPVSNLNSFSFWTYPLFPYQDLEKRWRTVGIMTRDFYQLRGKVIQKNGEPLAGANLSVPDYPSTIVTDKEGRFLIKDVKPRTVTKITADGFEPLFFTAVFAHDLTIALEKTGASDLNTIPIYKNIKDFSGTWKFKELIGLSDLKRSDDFSLIYNIHQYGSDSISIKMTQSSDKQSFVSLRSYVFNTSKNETKFSSENMISTSSCTIAPDGHSFLTTLLFHSKVGLFENQTTTEKYSLSDDGKQMTILRYYEQDNQNRYPAEIFERTESPSQPVFAPKGQIFTSPIGH
jgi:hypothetical protein